MSNKPTADPYQVQCDNCQWTGDHGEANMAKKLWERMEPGGIYTDVECPECGALAFPLDDADPEPEDPAKTKLSPHPWFWGVDGKPVDITTYKSPHENDDHPSLYDANGVVILGCGFEGEYDLLGDSDNPPGDGLAIEAAADMLEALEGAVHIMRKIPIQYDESISDGLEAACNSAQAAIAKAEGGA